MLYIGRGVSVITEGVQRNSNISIIRDFLGPGESVKVDVEILLENTGQFLLESCVVLLEGVYNIDLEWLVYY